MHGTWAAICKHVYPIASFLFTWMFHVLSNSLTNYGLYSQLLTKELKYYFPLEHANIKHVKPSELIGKLRSSE